MSRTRRMANNREIRKLYQAAITQIDIIDGEASTEEQKKEAGQRLAEISLRINLLDAENKGL